MFISKVIFNNFKPTNLIRIIVRDSCDCVNQKCQNTQFNRDEQIHRLDFKYVCYNGSLHRYSKGVRVAR